MYNYVAVPFIDITGVEVDAKDLAVKIRAGSSDSIAVYGSAVVDSVNPVEWHPLKTNTSGELEVVVGSTGSLASDIYAWNDGAAAWVAVESNTDGALYSSVTENVAHVSTLNSNNANILAGATWVGIYEEITNQSCIQFIMKYDQDTTVTVNQSLDGINVAVADSWNILANQGWSQAIASVAPYYQITIVNKNTVSPAVGNIVSAKTAIFNPLPRTLGCNGSLKTEIDHIEGKFGKNLVVTPSGALKSSVVTRLSGAAFDGLCAGDTNFWNITKTLTGETDIGVNALILETGVGALGPNGGVLVESKRYAGYVSGSPNYFFSNIQSIACTFNIVGGSCVKRWGAFNANNGYYFEEYEDETGIKEFRICTKKTAITTVASGSFNGNYGPYYVLDENNHIYEIIYNCSKVYFVIDDIVLHTADASSATLSGSSTLPIGLEVQNADNETSDNYLMVRSAVINRLGPLLTQPTSYYFANGQTAGYQLKTGAGNLHGMAIGQAIDGSIITLYDGIVGSGNVIWSTTIKYPAVGNFQPVSVDFKGLPYSTGLYLVAATQNSSCTVIYE